MNPISCLHGKRFKKNTSSKIKKQKKKIISYNSITLNINEINHTNESTSRKYFSWLSVNTGVNLINMYL